MILHILLTIIGIILAIWFACAAIGALWVSAVYSFWVTEETHPMTRNHREIMKEPLFKLEDRVRYILTARVRPYVHQGLPTFKVSPDPSKFDELPALIFKIEVQKAICLAPKSFHEV